MDQRHVVVVELAERLGVALLRAADHAPDVRPGAGRDDVGEPGLGEVDDLVLGRPLDDGQDRSSSAGRRRRCGLVGASALARGHGVGRGRTPAAGRGGASRRRLRRRPASSGCGMRAIDLLVGPPDLDRSPPRRARRITGARAAGLLPW